MGPGKKRIKIDGDILRAVLYNFDKNSAMLKIEHQKVLTEVVGPVVRDGGFAMLLGMASTTGTAAFDFQLGLARELSVRNFLVSKFGTKIRFLLQGKHQKLSVGKWMALAFREKHLYGGTDDNVESELWRAVWINAWSKGVPPPVPAKVDDPFDNITWVEDVGKAIDTLSLILGILDWFADVTDVASAAGRIGRWNFCGHRRNRGDAFHLGDRGRLRQCQWPDPGWR